MATPVSSPKWVRFGVYEVDLQARELRRRGRRLKLQDQPFQVLAMLLQHPGEVVTREALRERLWPQDTYVEFDHSVNTAVSKLREALGDSADNPCFVETLPRRGYRFLAPVEVVEAQKPKRWRRLLWATATGLAVVLAALVGLNVGGLRERLFGPATPKIDSIAVLPLRNLSGDPEQDYFVEGMHEALTSELSKIGALKVISRTSTIRYKETDKPTPQIARELGVAGLVQGSVLREGDQVRIMVQLIHGPTDRHLWAHSFDRELRSVLALQSEVARAIARKIRVSITPAEAARLARARPVNPEAHEFYLRGRYHWHRRGHDELERSLKYLQQSIELDPTYALAYAGLADVYVVQPSWGLAPGSEALRRAETAARKALELDESLAGPYATLGLVKESDRDWTGAEEDYRRALELDPNYATGHHWYGMWLSGVGRHAEAMAQLESAERLDPLAPLISTNLGVVLYRARRYDAAVQQLQKTVEIHPEFHGAFVSLATIHAAIGQHAEALAAVEGSCGFPEGTPEYGYVGWVYAQAGRTAEARRVLRRLQELSGRQFIDPGAIAIIYVGLGESDEALAWLERAYDERDAHLILRIKVDPVFDPLRDEPRFQALLRRMNYPQ